MIECYKYVDKKFIKLATNSFQESTAPSTDTEILNDIYDIFDPGEWYRDYYLDGHPDTTQTIDVECEDGNKRKFTVIFTCVAEHGNPYEEVKETDDGFFIDLTSVDDGSRYLIFVSEGGPDDEDDNE